MGKTLSYGEFKFGKSPSRPASKGYAKGGKTKGQEKVSKVMTEFKSGDLRSGSKEGPIVKNPKQAMAIALSEKKAAGYKKGGEAKKEPKSIVKQEIALLKKADAPAKIIKHEERELVEGYEGGGTVTPLSMMKDRAKSKEMVPQQRRAAATGLQNVARKTASPAMTERDREMMQMAKEQDMDRRMRQAEKEQPVHQRMLDEAMNPLSMMREMYDRATDRSGQSATENMKRYGMKEGGSANHDDIAKDKPMVKKMIHKHEKSMHPGKPLTKLKKGGVPVHNRNAKIC